METTMHRSMLQQINIPWLVGNEVFVPIYEWQAFFNPFYKHVKGIKQLNHLSGLLRPRD